MIETLFGYNVVDKNTNVRKKESSSQDPSPQYIQIIDSKKSQNLSILLRALNVTTEEVCDAIHEGILISSTFIVYFYTHPYTHILSKCQARLIPMWSKETYLDD